jgi:isocitrate/isopropylmalate dehydrogenase
VAAIAGVLAQGEVRTRDLGVRAATTEEFTRAVLKLC